MAQYIDKDALVAEIKGYISNYKEIMSKVSREDTDWVESTLMVESKIDVLQHLLSFLDTLEVKEVQEAVSEGLEKAANTYVDNWYKLNNLDKESYPIDVEISKNDFKAGAKWQRENLWKSADGDDLPEIDREVIVLYQRYPLESNEYAVGFAHRPPEFWNGKNVLTGEATRYYPKRYDKGEWNSPNIKWWLDLELPKGE